MKLKIIAKSDRGSFIGKTSEEGYTVITIDDTLDIDVGDVLSKPNAWDDCDGLFIEVRNLSKKESLNICIENWHMNFKSSSELLAKLGEPERILWLDPWPECGEQGHFDLG